MQLTALPDIALLLVVVIVLIFAVIRPARAVTKDKKVPTEGEWKAIGDHILEFDRDTLDEPDMVAEIMGGTAISGTSLEALRLVLADESGTARPGKLPGAVDLVGAAGEVRAKTLRSLSTLAIMLGLLATAVTFVIAFGASAFGNSGVDPSRIVAHLWAVYFANGIAIGCASWLFYKHRLVREQGERAAAMAETVLGRLEERGVGKDDPRFAAIVEGLTKQLENWSRTFLDVIVMQLNGLVTGMAASSDALTEAVKAIAQQGQASNDHALALAQSVSAQIETLATSLGDGFNILAQPFAQGTPAIDRLKEASQALERSGRALAPIPNYMEQLLGASEKANALVAELPTQVSGAMGQATVALVDGARTGVEVGTRAALQELRTEAQSNAAALDARLEAMNASITQSLTSLAGAVSELAASNVRAAEAAPKSCEARKLDVSLSTLHRDMSSVAALLARPWWKKILGVK